MEIYECLDPDNRRWGLQVRSIIATILGRAVADEEPLTVAGLDSLGSVEVQKELSRYIAVPVGAPS